MKQSLLLLLACIVSAAAFANLTQTNWRWRNNDGTEKTATWKAKEDSAIAVNDNNSFRLRLEIDNSQTDNKGFSRNLQYATSPGGPWYTISDRTQIAAFVYAGPDEYIGNGEGTTKQLSPGSYRFVPGSVVTNAGLYSDTIVAGTGREYEWCIRPSRDIQPFTTYYFKAADGDAPAVLPSITTGNAFTAKTVLLSNGSFENNLTGWTTVTKTGSSATFPVVQSTYHTGRNALQVKITNTGPYSSVGLTHGAIRISQPGIFLLRFWAVADKRNAFLTLNIKTASGNDTCRFQVYDRFDKTADNWQFYQYAFAAPAGSVSVQLGFNTKTSYYIDDVELISAGDATEDVTTQYNWQHNQAGYGWLSGDNDNSVLLPDSSVAWIFSDSFTGFPRPHSNVTGSAPIVNNIIVHEVKDRYTSVYKGTASSPQSLFSPGNSNIFWNSGGVVEGNKLSVVLMEIAGGGTYNNSTYIGTLSLPDLKVTGQVKTSYSGPSAPNTIFQDGSYNYLYLSERVSTFENYTQVARVPVGKLSSATTPWQFYTNSNTWSADYTEAKRIVAGVEAASVVKLADHNYAMSGVPNLSNEVAVWFAQSPEGPWVSKTVLYYIPSEEGVLPYEGHIDKGSGKDGVYTLSYSVYPFSGSIPQQLSDKGSYIPYYIKANLLTLSPFTQTALPLATSGFRVTKAKSTVRISCTTVTANSLFTIYKSSDAQSWQLLQTVITGRKNGLSSFEVYDRHPANGINYYKLEETGWDKSHKESSIKAVVFNDNKAVVSLYKNPANAAGIIFGIQNYEDRRVTATLIDLQGKVVSKQSFAVSAPASVHTLKIGAPLAAGLYLLMVQGNQLFYSTKVIIQ